MKLSTLLSSLAIPAFCLSMMTACAGSYHVTHESGTYASHEDDWCETHQTYHHSDEAVHGGMEIVIEEDVHPHHEVDVYVEEHTSGNYYETGHSGYTSCGDFLAGRGAQNTCHPGQYCSDATFSTCALGCLSDANCTSSQICVKNQGNHVGVCHSSGYYSAR